MIYLLLILATYCSNLYADYDAEGKIKTAVVSRRPSVSFDDYEEEKLAKRQKKFGTRASAASSISTGGKRPISTISRIFDKSKLGPVPSTYLDQRKKQAEEQIKAFVKEVNCDRNKISAHHINRHEITKVALSEELNDVSTWHKACNAVISY